MPRTTVAGGGGGGEGGGGGGGAAAAAADDDDDAMSGFYPRQVNAQGMSCGVASFIHHHCHTNTTMTQQFNPQARATVPSVKSFCDTCMSANRGKRGWVIPRITTVVARVNHINSGVINCSDYFTFHARVMHSR